MRFRYRVSPTDPVTRHTWCNPYKRTLYQPACFTLICQARLHQSSTLPPLHMDNRILRLRGTIQRIDRYPTLFHFRRTLRLTQRPVPTLCLLPRANQVINLPVYQPWQMEAVELLQNTGESTLTCLNIHDYTHFNSHDALHVSISRSLRFTPGIPGYLDYISFVLIFGCCLHFYRCPFLPTFTYCLDAGLLLCNSSL